MENPRDLYSSTFMELQKAMNDPNPLRRLRETTRLAHNLNKILAYGYIPDKDLTRTQKTNISNPNIESVIEIQNFSKAAFDIFYCPEKRIKSLSTQEKMEFQFKDWLKNFNNFIENYLKEKRITLNKLAQEVGISPRQLRRYRQGRFKKYPVEVLINLRRITGKDIFIPP